MIPVPKGCFRIQYLIHTYMDFRFLVAMAAVALSVFSSCTKDPLMMNGGGSSEGEAADFDDSAEIVPGWIRIKLADDSEPLRTGVFTRGGFDSGDVRLDELAAGLGATEIRRVFRDGGRFEERHRRYGLHLWYDIRIADEVPVSRARAEMVSLPGVDVVEPVYRVRLAEAHVVPDISDRLYRPFSEGEARPEPAPFNDPELSRQWHYNNDGSIEGSVADLFAPGGASSANPEDPKQVYSTYINGGYAYLWGTSMACPHVSGVAALIVSYYGVDTPGFTAERCREILLRSFRPVGEYVAGEPYADGLGAGLVDASLILLENPGIKPGSVEELTLTPLPDGMAIAAAMPADGNGDAVSKIRLGYAPVNGDGTTGEWREETFPNIQPAGGIFTTELQLAAEETYRVRMSVEDRYGNVSDEVTDEATTLPHVNVAPSYRGIETQLFTSTGKGFSKTVALDSYFSDPDIPYGDELTFAFDDGEQEILEVVLEGAELLLTPIYKGQTEIVVTATDRAGESASGTFRVRIVSGDEPPAEPEPDPEPDPDPDPDPDPVPGFDGDTMVVVPNPVGEALTVYVPHVASMEGTATIYDAAARKVLETTITVDAEGKGTLQVGGLSPGAYSLSVEVGGKSSKVSFMKR